MQPLTLQPDASGQRDADSDPELAMDFINELLKTANQPLYRDACANEVAAINQAFKIAASGLDVVDLGYTEEKLNAKCLETAEVAAAVHALERRIADVMVRNQVPTNLPPCS